MTLGEPRMKDATVWCNCERGICIGSLIPSGQICKQSGVYEKQPGVAAIKEQVGGNHYKDMAIQPIEYILKNGLGYCEGNVIKYISRYQFKNGVEDLKKAKHYIDLLIEAQDGGDN